MMKPRGAAYAEKGPVQFADAAGNVFQHLGEAGERLMQLQAQAATIVLMDSAARYAEVFDGVLQNMQPRQWAQTQRTQLRSAMEPLQAWTEAATGLQAVLLAASLRTVALMLFPSPGERHPVPAAISDRRTTSVIIPFPDRRRHTRIESLSS